MKMPEERIRELEDRSIESIQSPQKRIKRLKKMNRASGTLEMIPKGSIISITGFPEGERLWDKNILKK